MNRKFFILIVALLVLLIATPAVTWRSSAALAGQEPASPHDLDRSAALAPQAPVPGGPGFQMVNALQFRAHTPDLTAHFYNDELVNPGAMDNFYQAALTLPNHMTITGMVVYFYDNHTDDLLVALWRFDPSTGDHLEMATVASSGAQDLYLNSADTSILSPLVDQQSYSYYVEVGMPPAGSALRVAAVRIDYAYEVSLPSVAKNP